MTAETTAETTVSGGRSWLKVAATGIAAGLACIFCLVGFTYAGGWAVALFYLAPLPMLLAGLILGLDAMLISAITGLAVAMLIADFSSALTFVVGVCLPVGMIIGFYDERLWTTPITSLEGETRRKRVGHMLVLIACVIGFGFALTELGMQAVGMKGMHGMLFGNINIDAITPEQLQLTQYTVSLMQYMPGLLALVMLGMVYSQTKLACWLIRWRTEEEEPRIVFGDANLPLWFFMAAVAAAIVSVISPGRVGFAFINLATILALPAVLVGLGVVNAMLKGLPYRWLFSTLVYAVLILGASFGSLYVIALVGFLDGTLHLREWIIARLGAKKERKHA
jgi:hypothetical protein